MIIGIYTGGIDPRTEAPYTCYETIGGGGFGSSRS